MTTLQIITELKTYINTLSEEDKKYIDYCIKDRFFDLPGLGNLANLLDKLQTQYKHEEAKKSGSPALKRQKVAEKILKANRGGVRPQFEKAWKETIRGEERQIFGCPYYIITLKDDYEANVETETEDGKITFRVDKFFNEEQKTNKVDFDIAEVKQSLAEWKAEQKQKPAKMRDKSCTIKIGNSGYNAEFFINCYEAMGSGAELYQNENPCGVSYFEAESGTALIMPCRL